MNKPSKQDDLKIPPQQLDNQEKGRKLIGMETSEVGNVSKYIGKLILYEVNPEPWPLKF